jgi:NADPH-ferrihemoprotein reductase
MLRVLADYTEDEEERKKLLKLASDDPEDQDYFQQYIQKDDRTIIEVLKDFPGVKPPLDHFLEVMPRQQPRFYSISSSSNVRDD